MNLVANNCIKEIQVSKFYPEDWDEFQETFSEYYGRIEEMMPEENRNPDGSIKVPYNVRVQVKEWHDTEPTYNFLKRLQTRGSAKIASNSETLWDIVPVVEEKIEGFDEFPAPELEADITNAELAARCWAPIKLTHNSILMEDEVDEIIPEFISYDEHLRIVNEITRENEKNIAEKVDWHNDCIQYAKLYYAALEHIKVLEKNVE